MDQMTRDAHRRLTERRQSLTRQLAALTQDDAEVAAGTDSRDRFEGPTGAELRETGAELREIEAALARIEAGTYGNCEKCDHVIGRQRLYAVPKARLCLACSSNPELARGTATGSPSLAPRSK